MKLGGLRAEFPGPTSRGQLQRTQEGTLNLELILFWQLYYATGEVEFLSTPATAWQ